MAEARICDRCGKVFSHSVLSSYIRVTRGDYNPSLMNSKPQEYEKELCPKCAYEVDKLFIKKEDTDENGTDRERG